MAQTIDLTQRSSSSDGGSNGRAPTYNPGDESMMPIAQRWRPERSNLATDGQASGVIDIDDSDAGPSSPPRRSPGATPAQPQARPATNGDATMNGTPTNARVKGLSKEPQHIDSGSSDRSLTPPPPMPTKEDENKSAEPNKLPVKRKAPTSATGAAGKQRANGLANGQRKASSAATAAAAELAKKAAEKSIADEEAKRKAKREEQLTSTQESRLILPSWISHMVSATGGGTSNVIVVPAQAGNPDDGTGPTEEKEGRRKRGTIFSVHVHPDGSRIATAGLDMKIKIWNTAPILDPDWERDVVAEEEVRKQVQREEQDARRAARAAQAEAQAQADAQAAAAAAGSAADGAAPAASTSANGLAVPNGPDLGSSQSEDTRTISVEEERRKHKLLATLTRHTGSVLVVRWSHSGRYLASGSDDTIALIWEWDRSTQQEFPLNLPTTTVSAGHAAAVSASALDGPTIENWRPVRRLAGHTSDVVDVAWAPSDLYLATVSLDSVVIVYNGRTFDRLRRIDGHAGFIKGVCFDPVGQYMATAADDKTLKVWRTADWSCEQTVTEPFKGSPSSTFFRRPGWSPDGAHILCANAMSGPVFVSSVVERDTWSSDISLVGHENCVAVAAFSPKLFQAVSADGGTTHASLMALGSLDQSVSVWLTGLSKPILVARDVFERQVMDLSWTADGLTLYACSADGSVAAFVFDPAEVAQPAAPAELAKAKANWGYRPTAAQAAMLASNSHSIGTTAGTAGKPNMLTVRKAKGGPAQPANKDVLPPAQGAAAVAVNGSAEHDYGASGIVVADEGAEPDMSRSPSKRRISNAVEDLEPLVRSNKRAKDTGKTLGAELGNRSAPTQRKQLVREEEDNSDVEVVSTSGVRLQGGRWLPSPTVMNIYTREQRGLTLDCRNSSQATQASEISLVRDGKVCWMDWVPSVATTGTCNDSFTAVALEDSSLLIYSARGARLAMLRLASPCIQVESTPSVIMLLTSDGDVRRISFPDLKDMHAPVSIRNVINGPKDVEELWLHANGVPVLICRAREEALVLDSALCSWVSPSSGFFADCSPFWEARRRGREASLSASREPVRSIEGLINQLVVQRPPEKGLIRHEPPKDAAHAGVFKTACGLRHLEGRMQAAILLDSPVEYKTALLAYAKNLSEEGIKNIAEDLIKSLMGPVYYKPDTPPTWDSWVLGYKKRELLDEVLTVLGKGRHLNGLVSSYQDILRALQ